MKITIVYYILWPDWETFVSIRLPLLKEFSRVWGDDIQILCVTRTVDFLFTPFVNRKRLKDWLIDKGKVKRLGENLFVFSPVVTVHDRAAHLIPFMEALNARMLRWQISRALRSLRSKPDKIIHWFSYPLQHYYLRPVKADLTIYHCSDDWAAFPGLSRLMRFLIPPREKMMFKEVNLVFATSGMLFKKARLYNEHVYLFPGSADTEFFAKALDENLKIPDDIASIRKPIIGYSGSIYGVTDLALVSYLASRHPEWSFVLIGPVAYDSIDRAEFESLLRFPNVHYLGYKEYKHLPNYFKAFDVCMALYNNEKYSESVFPNKIFQYLAAGKPVISICLPDVRRLKGVVRMADNYDEFEREVCLALTQNDSSAVHRRLLIAKNNSINSRVNAMSHVIRKALKQDERIL